MTSTQPRATAPVFRAAAERFHTRLDWLDSWHSFSFGSHLDPTWMGFGPLRVINDDTIAPGGGFGMHPHRDMEIITVMVEGELHHRDSMGHAEVLRAGELQRMSAGTGIVHSEINGGTDPCRLLQIWIEPEHRGVSPSYGQKAFELAGGWTPLLDPSRSDGAMAIGREVQLWRARLEGGQALPLPPAGGQRTWLQMISGSGRLERRDGLASLELVRGDGIGFPAGPASPAPDGWTAGPEGSDLLLFHFA